MSRGRPAQGPKLVENLQGSQEAKKRLRVVLETVAGERDVVSASSKVGMGRTAFFEIRNRALQASLEDLEPKRAGRPPREVTAEQVEIERLKEENEKLRTDLEIAQVREEIMLAMPEVFEPGREAAEKKRPKKPGKAEKKRRRNWRKKLRQKAKGKRVSSSLSKST